MCCCIGLAAADSFESKSNGRSCRLLFEKYGFIKLNFFFEICDGACIQSLNGQEHGRRWFADEGG
jgi:hypothetical protein